jgi:nucleotide-binding universal stress UspA family protein
MSINAIFLFAPSETTDTTKGPAAFAISLAKAHDAHLTIFTVALDVTTPGRQSDAGAVAAALTTAAMAASVQFTLVTEHSHAIGIHEVVAEHARLHDISVIGTNSDGLLSERTLAEHVMFESGRPLIVVPQSYAVPYQPSTIAAAWDNGAPAARALGDAITLFAPKTIALLAIEGEKPMPTDIDHDRLAMLTSRRGTDASFKVAPLGNRSIGGALQAEAAASGAGMLAMGAYGHSRLRRFVLGSATGDILKNCEMPILLSH